MLVNKPAYASIQSSLYRCQAETDWDQSSYSWDRAEKNSTYNTAQKYSINIYSRIGDAGFALNMPNRMAYLKLALFIYLGFNWLESVKHFFDVLEVWQENRIPAMSAMRSRPLRLPW